MASETFWVVMNEARGLAAQPMRHSTPREAQREAARISKLEPGAKVYVLQACGYAIKRETDWVECGHPYDASRTFDLDDEIPF